MNLRTLSLTQLLSDPSLVERLVASGDSLLVERAGPPRAAAAVASLANTLGGWVLVDGGPDPDLAVDPPAPHAAATVEVAGRQVHVIRVAASGDTPHITPSGRVLVRGHDGTEPADDDALRALVARGEAGVAAAAARLNGLPLVELAMRTPERLPGDAPILDPDHMGHDAPLELIVRATPVTITRTLAAKVLTQEGADLAAAQAIPLLVDPDAVAHRVATTVEGRTRGIYVTAERGEAPIFADLAIDAGGVVAARLAERRQRDGTVAASALVDEVLLPLLRTISGTLQGLDATGPRARPARDPRRDGPHDRVDARAHRRRAHRRAARRASARARRRARAARGRRRAGRAGGAVGARPRAGRGPARLGAVLAGIRRR